MKRTNTAADVLNTGRAKVDVGDGIIMNLPLDGVYTGEPGPPGAGVPAGGSALQVVRKDATGTATEWATLAKADVGLGNVNNTSDADKPLSTDAIAALAGKEPSISGGTTSQFFRGDKTFVTPTKNDVGLGNVDNTADANKPVSAAQATALAGKVAKGDLAIRALDYIVADGSTDDSAGISSAMSAGATFGVPVHLPLNAVIGLASRVNLPAGLTLHTNGASFKGLAETGDFLLTLASNTRVVGPLSVEVSAGANVRGVAISGATRVNADSIRVTAPAAGAGVGDGNDSALLITGSTDITAGAVAAANFDYPVKIATSSNVTIGRLDITGYVRGTYITDSTAVCINGGVIQTASPNASYTAGHNAVLIDATDHDLTTDLRFNNLIIKDSGEHGLRVGGNKRVRRVFVSNMAVVNVGASGIKVLGGTEADLNYHEDIEVNGLIVEDAGQTPQNMAGIMLQFVRRATINGLIVRKKTKTYSAGHGVEIQCAEDTIINSPIIQDTLTACFAVEPVLGNSTNVRLNGGTLTSATGDGILINYTGRTYRRVSVENQPQVEISGSGYVLNLVNTSGGAITGGAKLSWQSVSAAARQVEPSSTTVGYYCDVFAAMSSTVSAFKNGSRWVDNSASMSYLRASGAWFIQDLICTTAARPTTASVGQRAYDTTLQKPIWLKTTPSTWIDAAGTTV